MVRIISYGAPLSSSRLVGFCVALVLPFRSRDPVRLFRRSLCLSTRRARLHSAVLLASSSPSSFPRISARTFSSFDFRELRLLRWLWPLPDVWRISDRFVTSQSRSPALAKITPGLRGRSPKPFCNCVSGPLHSTPVLVDWLLLWWRDQNLISIFAYRFLLSLLLLCLLRCTLIIIIYM